MIVANNLKVIFDAENEMDIVEAIQKYIAQKGDFAKGKHGDKDSLPHGISAIFLNGSGGVQNSNLLEAHRKYSDLHFTIKGIDTIAFKQIEECTAISKDYTEDGDYLLYAETPTDSIEVTAGNFCFIPNQFAHMALYENRGLVTKLVFKIPVQ